MARLPVELSGAGGLCTGHTTPRPEDNQTARQWRENPPAFHKRKSNALFSWIDQSPRRVLALISAACVAMLAFGLYLQYGQGLEPCPMCIVQRYALIGVAVFTGLAGSRAGLVWRVLWSLLALVTAGFGAFVAARQSWLQWYPPEVATCGRDFYGIVENYALSRAIPMIFRGSGDCTVVDWRFLGGSIANWSFICFTFFALLLITLLVRAAMGRRA